MRWLPILRMRALTWHGDPLAALISFQTLTDLLNNYGYIAVTFFVMIESSGIPFPGETMLLLAAFTAGAVPNHLSIPLVIACAALGAIIGDNLGYYVGRTGGRAFVLRFGKYLFLKQEHLDRAEKFFAKHGDKTVFFGRFVAVLRAWAAFLAGVNQMRWRNFLIYNAAGGILWATIFGTLGYFAGRFLHDNFAQVEKIASRVSLAGAIAIVAVVVAAIIIVRVRRARRSQSQSTTKTSDEKVESANDGKTEPVNDAKGAPTTDEKTQPGNNGKVEPPNDTKVAPVIDEKGA
jgi:membrane protein DedA with SNARE-associated domain